MADAPSAPAVKTIPKPRDPALARYGRLHPVSFDGRRAASQERASRRPHGDGRHRDRSIQGFHAVRRGRSALVRPWSASSF
jgi:hypothetical protein